MRVSVGIFFLLKLDYEQVGNRYGDFDYGRLSRRLCYACACFAVLFICVAGSEL